MKFFFIFIVYLFLRTIIREVFSDGKKVRRAPPNPNFKKVLNRLYTDGFQPRSSKPIPASDRALFEEIKNLYQHYEKALDGDTDFFYHYLRPAIVQPGLLNALLRAYGAYYQDLFRMIKYWEQHKAIRPIKTWDPVKHQAINLYIEDLIRHLFEHYPVSPPLESVWWVWNWDSTRVFLTQALDKPMLQPSEGQLDIVALELYFHLTEGGSLRQPGLFKSGLVSKQIAFYWGQAPVGWRIVPAFWWAVARAEGVSEEKTMALAWTPSSLEDLQFWRAFYRIVARENLDELNQCDIHDLAEMIELIKFGKGALADIDMYRQYSKLQPEFSVKGRTLKSTERYFDELLGLSYKPIEGIDDRYSLPTDDGAIYEIVRLTDRKALQEEGEILDHCVGSSEYHDDCRCGYGSIWSLRKNGEADTFERLITIELGDKSILAMSGQENRNPSPVEYELIRQWAEVHELMIEE
ncbi:MAG: hypothetical protein DHS20C18_01760 [Saprospiraceae bacterium]|nr:MAG: hypothetical protein DHS20C18_01760 [Saprospiraceae bacterium]